MSSKYSPKEKISRKLEQSIEEHLSSLAVSEKDDLPRKRLKRWEAICLNLQNTTKKKLNAQAIPTIPTGAAPCACSSKIR